MVCRYLPVVPRVSASLQLPTPQTVFTALEASGHQNPRCPLFLLDKTGVVQQPLPGVFFMSGKHILVFGGEIERREPLDNRGRLFLPVLALQRFSLFLDGRRYTI